MKNNLQKIQALKDQKTELLNTFRLSNITTESYKETESKVKAIDEEIKNLQLIDKVNLINHLNNAKKALIAEFLPIGLINKKFITNEGILNKTMEKQQPLLYCLAEKYNARFSFDYDQNVKIYINKDRQSFAFVLSFVDYTIDKKDRKNIAFDSVQSACKGNNTLFEPLKINEVKKQLENINKATEKIKKQLDQYKIDLEKNNCFFFENENIVTSLNPRTNIIYY